MCAILQGRVRAITFILHNTINFDLSIAARGLPLGLILEIKKRDMAFISKVVDLQVFV